MAELIIKIAPPTFLPTRPVDGDTIGYTIRENGQNITYSGSAGADNVFKTFKLNNSNKTVSSFIRVDGQYNTIDQSFSGLTSGFKINSLDGAIFSVNKQGAKYIVGGQFLTYNGVSVPPLVRLNADGSLDTTFNFTPPTGVNVVNKIFVQNDNKIIYYGYNNGNYAFTVNRLLSNGSSDVTFNSNVGIGPNDRVYNMALNTDGSLIICGAFTTFNGITKNHITKLTSSGTLDGTFSSGSGFGGTGNYYPGSLGLQSNGSIIVGGGFTTYKGLSTQRLIRLTSTGGLDTSFNSGSAGPNDVVTCLFVTSTDKIYIYGGFTSYNGNTRSTVALINSNGSTDGGFTTGTGFSSGASLIFGQDAIISDGGTGVYLALNETSPTYNGTSFNKIIRLTNTGSIESDFNLNNGPVGSSGSIYELFLDGTKLIVGGSFNSYLDNSPVTSTKDIVPIGTGVTSTMVELYNNLTTFNAHPDIVYELTGSTINVKYTYNETTDIVKVLNVKDLRTRKIYITYTNPPLNVASVILTESPFYLTYSSAEQYAAATFRMWVHTGTINNYSLLASPTYQFTKNKLLSTDTDVSINIADFVNGLLKPKLDETWFTSGSTFSTNFDEVMFVHYEIEGFTSTGESVSTDNGDLIAVKGYGYFNQGPNPRLSSDVLSDMSNSYLSEGNKAWLAELNLPATSATTTSNIITRTAISGETECSGKYEPYQIVYLNKNGVFEGFSFPKLSRRVIKNEQADYVRLSSQPYRYSTTNHYRTIANKASNEEITLNTDILSKNDIEPLKQLILSKVHYLIDSDDTITPVILKAEDFTIKTGLNDGGGNVQYTLTFEMANEVQNNIR